MPSGCFVDSMWITSAPSTAHTYPMIGPAQNAVRSTIRIPASGRLGAGVARRKRAPPVEPPPAGGRDDARCRGRRPVRPRTAAAPRPHPTGTAPMAARSRPGSRRTIRRRPGGAYSGRVAPLPTSATGIRNSVASSTISAVVRADVHSSITVSSSARCSVRYVPRARRSSACQSSRPIIVQKSSHCWPVVVCKATKPSRLGWRFGSCDDRTGRNGSPAISYHVTGKSGWLNISASSAATSTRSPMPQSACPAQRRQRADGGVGAGGPVAGPAPAQQRRAGQAYRVARAPRTAPAG